MPTCVENATIITQKIIFEKNESIVGDNFQMKPSIIKKIARLDDAKYYIEIEFKIENSDRNPFPMNIFVSARAIFDFSSIEKEMDIVNFLNVQGFQFLFPYIRNIVSSLTANAMVSPIILPLVNPNEIESINTIKKA